MYLTGRKGPGTSTSSNGDRAEAKNWYPMTTRSPAKYPPPVYSQGWDAPLDNRSIFCAIYHSAITWFFMRFIKFNKNLTVFLLYLCFVRIQIDFFHLYIITIKSYYFIVLSRIVFESNLLLDLT